MPFDDLLVAGTPGVGEDKTAERVATLVSTMRVHLSSSIIRSHVDEGLVDVAGNLDVVGGPHELSAGDSTCRNDTSAMAGLGAPCDGLTLSVADNAVGLRGAPEAPVVEGVDDGGLAVGGRTFGGRVASVV